MDALVDSPEIIVALLEFFDVLLIVLSPDSLQERTDVAALAVAVDGALDERGEPGVEGLAVDCGKISRRACKKLTCLVNLAQTEYQVRHLIGAFVAIIDYIFIYSHSLLLGIL